MNAFAPLAGSELGRSNKAAEDAWRPILPVPDTAPQPTSTMIKRFAPEAHVFTEGWRYHDSEGRLLGYVVRYDGPLNGKKAKKDFKPLTFCEGPNGRREWRAKAFPEPRPLYGLDRLAARPDAPVLVVEGEKAADAAVRRFPDFVPVTSPGGSNVAGKADWTPLAGCNVTVWPDADNVGQTYADEVAELAQNAGAASVRVVSVATVASVASLPRGWDLADELPAGMTDADLDRMLAEAKAPDVDGPLPLFPPLPKSERFPIEALGPVLSRAAGAISRKVQVPESMAAQSVLAAAALACQAHADVKLPYGQSRPLSLFFITVAGSGDRKSSADSEALWPIRKREKALKEEHDREHHNWLLDAAAWNAEKRKIEADKKLHFEARKQELRALGPEPQRPLYPLLTAPDPTVEGLVKAWVSAPASLGIFSAEGGQFIGGHGMTAEHRLKTAATYSAMWDGQPVKRVRAGDGVTVLLGRRLSVHLMVQHEAAAQFLGDPLLRDQGLLSRMLVAAPESLAGSRLYRDTAPEDDEAIRTYGARLLSILEAHWPLAEAIQNELECRVLEIAPDAAATWRAFHDHVEAQCGPGNDLAPIQDFAAKAAEHAARIAGVLTLVEDLTATEIGLDAMGSALKLTDWYVVEALRLQRAARTDPRLLRAQQLLEWMQERGEALINFREIMRLGPNPVRTKSVADEAVNILIGHGWITEVSARPRCLRLLMEGTGK